MFTNRGYLGAILILWLLAVQGLTAQQDRYVAIIPPFHDRLNSSDRESPLELQHQRFVLFVYRDAVGVLSEGDFVYTGADTIEQEFALPSTGHVANEYDPDPSISNGILGVQMWVEGKRVGSELIHSGDEDWYTIRTVFRSGEHRKIKSLFWAQTSLTDVDSIPGIDTIAIAGGPREFVVDLAHAAVWNGTIGSIDVVVVLRDSLDLARDHFDAVPDTYDESDSSLTWTMRDVEPSVEDNITISYIPSDLIASSPTMMTLSTFVVRNVYDPLIEFTKQFDE